MSSRYRSGKSTSVGSSPRKIIGAGAQNAASLVVPPISSKPGCSTQSDSQSPLQSAWIQRIIPLSHTSQHFPEEVQEQEPVYLEHTKLPRKEIDFKATDGQVVDLARPMDMNFTDRRADTLPVKDTSSWLTVRDSLQEERPSCNGSPSKPTAIRNNEAQLVFRGGEGLLLRTESPANTLEHRGRISASSDSKVFFVENKPGGCSQQNVNPSPSAWITNRYGDAGCKVEVKVTAEDNNKAIRIFPPLKSGEQWPGTLKPSGLSPLRIPSSSEDGRDVRIHQGYGNDSVNVQRKRQVPPPMRSLSLFDSLDDRRQASESSFTRSLPSSFVANLYDKNRNSDRLKSLQDSYGLVESNASSQPSDTKSLFQDDENAEDEDDENTEGDSARAVKGKRIRDAISSGGTSNSIERPKQPDNRQYNFNLQSSRQHLSLPRPPRFGDQEKLKAPVNAPDVQQTDKAGRSRGSQQWVQRWCSSSHPPVRGDMKVE